MGVFQFAIQISNLMLHTISYKKSAVNYCKVIDKCVHISILDCGKKMHV